MARKMGPDGPKLQICEKNGHHYAYRSTSKMVDGRKKTVNEFVGRYDPETGTIIPKKPMKPIGLYGDRDASVYHDGCHKLVLKLNRPSVLSVGHSVPFGAVSS